MPLQVLHIFGHMNLKRVCWDYILSINLLFDFKDLDRSFNKMTERSSVDSHVVPGLTQSVTFSTRDVQIRYSYWVVIVTT